jgi:MoaA/NifB/PqqE/SkfB family radical SAM enzyme
MHSNHLKAPQKLAIDPCTQCQLACPGCPNTDLGEPPGMGWGVLQFEHFKQLIDQNPAIKEVEFHCFGEAFLNKALVEMLRYGANRGLSFIFTSANFNHISEEMITALVECNVREITVAFEGLTQESYAIYRKRGKLSKVLENIKKLNAAKALAKSDSPAVQWLWIVFGHTEHEIPKAKKLAKELNMGFLTKMQWDSSYSPIRDPESLKLELGWDAVNREEYIALHDRDYKHRVCHQLWQAPRINWDGLVLGCCWTQIGFGSNAIDEGYEQAINGDRISYARKMLRGEAPPREDIPCTRCKMYLDLVARERYISADDIENFPYDG